MSLDTSVLFPLHVRRVSLEKAYSSACPRSCRVREPAPVEPSRLAQRRLPPLRRWEGERIGKVKEMSAAITHFIHSYIRVIINTTLK